MPYKLTKCSAMSYENFTLEKAVLHILAKFYYPMNPDTLT